MDICFGDVTGFIEKLAPVKLAEDWDNSGLQVGSQSKTVKKVMVCLDVTSRVADEAVDKGVDMIISHHPLIFKGIKAINSDTLKGKTIYKLIKNDISVYSAHTNLDVTDGGINDLLAGVLKLENVKNLNQYREEKLFKLVVFVPESSAEVVRDAICSEGAGWIGNYSECTFTSKGIGTFKPLDGTNPYIGSAGNLEKVNECRLETIISGDRLERVINSMLKAHPYEEVAYDIYPLEIKGKQYGLGKIGILPAPVNLPGLIEIVKSKLGITSLRVIGESEREIMKVGVFCGSFDENWSGVIREKIDVLVTGDIKYHTAVDAAEMGICVIDAGHFNTEAIIVPALIELISGKFSGLTVIGSSVEKDPFKYC